MNYVNAKGEPLDIRRIAKKHKPIPKPKSEALKRVNTRDEAKVSMGFVVLGYSPEHWAEKGRDYAISLELHNERPTENKHPGSAHEHETR